MSDIEDLARTVDPDSHIPDHLTGSDKRVAAGKRFGRICRDRSAIIRTDPDRLRMSGAKPSLPKLKFLENGSGE